MRYLMMLQFRMHLNITKLGEITAFINKEMEDERNTDREVEYVLPINEFIFVPEKSKQRDDLRNMKFARTQKKNPSLFIFDIWRQ